MTPPEPLDVLEENEPLDVLEENRRHAGASRDDEGLEGCRPLVIEGPDSGEPEKNRNFAVQCHQSAEDGAFSRWAAAPNAGARGRPTRRATHG